VFLEAAVSAWTNNLRIVEGLKKRDQKFSFLPGGKKKLVVEFETVSSFSNVFCN